MTNQPDLEGSHCKISQVFRHLHKRATWLAKWALWAPLFQVFRRNLDCFSTRRCTSNARKVALCFDICTKQPPGQQSGLHFFRFFVRILTVLVRKGVLLMLTKWPCFASCFLFAQLAKPKGFASCFLFCQLLICVFLGFNPVQIERLPDVVLCGFYSGGGGEEMHKQARPEKAWAQ